MLRLFYTALFILCMVTVCPEITGSASPWENEETEDYITIVDDKNMIILQTGLFVRPGDQYIDEANRLYKITSVEGQLAKATLLSQHAILFEENTAIPVQAQFVDTQPIIAVYHTHTDEGYIPTDGKATDPGKGSIMRVGDALSTRLTALGFHTIHDKTLHDPHDANAYQRSRRTFLKLLEQQPEALFDIHRDSAPVNIYQTTIDGQAATKILLVVGRQNQNQATTLDYAKKIKISSDAKYKGLIRGIFIAHGNYNQDLNPHSMLLEIGTQYNTLEAAAHSAALFADVVPSFLAPVKAPETPLSSANTDDSTNSAPQNEADDSTGEDATVKNIGFNNSIMRDLSFVIASVIIGTIAYLYLSTGGWKEAKAKLARFRKYEFTNFFGSRKKRKN